MSSEKVQEFLQKKEQEKVKQEAQFRYKILSLYDLGEKVYYKEGEPIEDYPLSNDTGVKNDRFRYDCNISEEDFKKVSEIYKQELMSSETNDGAEKILGIFALILLIIGIITFFILTIAAIEEEEWVLFGYGLGVFLGTLIEYAFTKVFVNISHKLDKIANLLKKSEK